MLNNAWPFLIPRSHPFPLISLFLHLLLAGSQSSHHSTEQINYREKLRMANQGVGSWP